MVLRVLLDAGDHLEAADVLRRVRGGMGRVSTQAVYNVLEALSRCGLVRRIEPPGRAALFEARVGDNHHHLICRRCAAVVNLDCAAERVPCLLPSEAHDYAIDEAEVTWYGLCAKCQTEDPLD
jgi:Fur family ferric uptake transcriptional regulator